MRSTCKLEDEEFERRRNGMSRQGRPSRKPIMHIPLFCIFPPISNHASESMSKFRNDFFPAEFIFFDPNFLITFRKLYTFPPISEKYMHFTPISEQLLHSPYLRPTYVFWLHLRVFASPYFDHDTLMHHALHVLSSATFHSRLKIELFKISYSNSTPAPQHICHHYRLQPYTTTLSPRLDLPRF